VLEAQALEVGVVTGVQHMSRHRVVIGGVEAHAGPTPMSMRKDPMMALAVFLPRLYELADEHGPDGRVTFGFIHAEPGSSNTVPGRLELTVDIRHPDESSYRDMLHRYEAEVTSACHRYSLPLEMHCFWEAPGVVFDPNCVAAVRAAVTQLGYSHRDIVSGAGHDACNLSAVVPTSMVFVPCEGGLSHNEAEAITAQQAETGANVLLLAMLERAGVEA
jgi:N-carbamoyl-L-amino-acid hydrolase